MTKLEPQPQLQLKIFKTEKLPYSRRKNQIEDNDIKVEIEVAFEVEKGFNGIR